jgi:hypothetical protein
MNPTLPEAIAAVVQESQAALKHCADTAQHLSIQDQVAMLVRLIGIRGKIANATRRKVKCFPHLGRNRLTQQPTTNYPHPFWYAP